MKPEGDADSKKSDGDGEGLHILAERCLAISVFIHLVSVSIYCKSRRDDRNRVGGHGHHYNQSVSQSRLPIWF